MEDSQDPTTPEEDVLEGIVEVEVIVEEEIQETIEVAEEEEELLETEIETATADVVDGNTVKLKDPNYILILR